MSTFTRGSTLRGPAIVEFNNTIIRTKGDVKVNLALETFSLDSSETPNIDERISGIPCSIEFEPVGIINAGIVNTLFSPLTAIVGSSLFGTQDKPCTITPISGKEKITFHCCAITKMPDIFFSATKTALGPAGITAILKNSTEWSNAAARLTIADVAAPQLAAYDPTEIPTNAARIAWGTSAPWTTISSREGVVISFDMATEPEITDEHGLVDMVLAGIVARARFSPMGANVAQALAALAIQGEGVARGASLAARAKKLVVESASPGGLKATINKAASKTLPLIYGRSSPRFSEFELVSLPTDGTVATVEIVQAPAP